MIAPTATIRRYLSSLLLALSASPVKDPVRYTLQATANHFSRDVVLATVLVAIGVALEGMELVHVAANWLNRLNRRRHDRAELTELGEVFPCGDARGETASLHEPKWVKVALRLGLILVVIGVVGEWRCGAKLEDAHSAIHQYDLERIAEADKRAGDAAKSATTAHEEADAAGVAAGSAQKKADAVAQKADNLNRQLSAAEGRVAMVTKTAGDLARHERYVFRGFTDQMEINKRLEYLARDRKADPAAFASLNRFPHPVIRIGYSDVGESYQFALSAAIAINRSRWAKVMPDNIEPLPHPQVPLVGDHIYARSVLPEKEAQAELISNFPTHAAYALARAIGPRIGDCDVLKDDSLSENQFRIVIGERRK
jgi:hypothetical protein